MIEMGYANNIFLEKSSDSRHFSNFPLRPGNIRRMLFGRAILYLFDIILRAIFRITFSPNPRCLGRAWTQANVKQIPRATARDRILNPLIETLLHATVAKPRAIRPVL